MKTYTITLQVVTDNNDSDRSLQKWISDSLCKDTDNRCVEIVDVRDDKYPKKE